jgi:hypothetical protein
LQYHCPLLLLLSRVDQYIEWSVSMKMMQIVGLVGISLCFNPVLPGWAQDTGAGHEVGAPGAGEASAQDANKWQAAGQEVKDASSAVAEATRETAGTAWDSLKSGSSEVWEKTKSGSQELYETAGEKSKQAWRTTKEESRELWQKGKATIHEATAPETTAPQAPPAPPEPAPPAAPAMPTQPEAASPAPPQQ